MAFFVAPKIFIIKYKLNNHYVEILRCILFFIAGFWMCFGCPFMSWYIFNAECAIFKCSNYNNSNYFDINFITKCKNEQPTMRALGKNEHTEYRDNLRF
eukprot:6093_1